MSILYAVNTIMHIRNTVFILLYIYSVSHNEKSGIPFLSFTQKHFKCFYYYIYIHITYIFHRYAKYIPGQRIYWNDKTNLSNLPIPTLTFNMKKEVRSVAYVFLIHNLLFEMYLLYIFYDKRPNKL